MFNNFSFIKHRRLWYAISGTLVSVSVLVMLLFGLQLGLDFTGGSLMEITFTNKRPDTTLLQETLSNALPKNYRIQPAGQLSYIIRTEELTEDEHQRLIEAVRNKYTTDDNNGAGVLEQRFESFGSSVGAELQRRALYAILTVLIAIISYLAYSFRSTSRPVSSWKYGAVAVIALIHDVLVTVGLFAVLGRFFGTQIDGYFITALLTLLGFSVHDTIVTLDRIRENILKLHNIEFPALIDISTRETIIRSINTSLSTVLPLIAVYFLGGESIRDLSLALIFGISIGTYSSIFVASPLLITLFYRPSKTD